MCSAERDVAASVDMNNCGLRLMVRVPGTNLINFYLVAVLRWCRVN
jgi:hypothetical protein